MSILGQTSDTKFGVQGTLLFYCNEAFQGSQQPLDKKVFDTKALLGEMPDFSYNNSYIDGPLASCASGQSTTCINYLAIYHINRNINSDFNLAIWQTRKDRQINLRYY